jgi:hypothetical protein
MFLNNYKIICKTYPPQIRIYYNTEMVGSRLAGRVDAATIRDT